MSNAKQDQAVVKAENGGPNVPTAAGHQGGPNPLPRLGGGGGPMRRGGRGGGMPMGMGMGMGMGMRRDPKRVGQQMKQELFHGGDDRRSRPNRMNEGGGMLPRSAEDRIMDKVSSITGPTIDLPTFDNKEKKFASRNRLYVGNITNDITEEDFKEMFKAYGETSEIFINKEKNFAFVRLDYRSNAEKAKSELDGTSRNGRTLRIRFAPSTSAIKVKNLTSFVTNELLHLAFSVFGDVERCVVIVDDRGKHTGEGIVEFVRKPAAMAALRHCSDSCYFLTASLRPVVVELYNCNDDIDGFPEKTIVKRTPEFYKAREMGPRFAAPDSFEHEYGSRWKQLHELYRQKEAALKQEMSMEEEKLEAQMEFARYEHETEMLREQLRAREMDRERQKREWEMKERQAEEARIRNEEQVRRQQEEMQLRMHHQEEDLRRRQQENSLFIQAHQLSNMLDQQEQVMDQYGTAEPQSKFETQAADGPGTMPMDPKTFMNNYDRSRGGGHRFGDREGGGPGPRNMNMGRGGGHWGADGRRDDFGNPKRRRF